MGGLVGSWGRNREDRQMREIARRTNQWSRVQSLEPDHINGVQWFVQMAIQKRRCRVHVTWDRCWKKPKEASR